MKVTFYPLFSIALLAGGLAACSTDQPAQYSQVSAPTAPPAPPAHSAEVPPAAAWRAARAPRPAPAAHPAQWVRRPAPAAKSLALRAALPESAAETASRLTQYPPLPPDEVGPPPDNDLSAFCVRAAPQSEVFQVQPGRDTVLLGQQGTRLVVPANAFDVPLGSGPVALSMREFYTIADIVLAGLGTRTATGLLETGGMLHLSAVAGGQTVHLRPGMQLLVQLPTQQQLPGMRLYEGKSIDFSHAPEWQLPDTSTRASGRGLGAANPLASRAALGEWVKLHPPKSPRWPYFEKSKQLLKEYARALPNTKADQARLRRKRTVDKDEQQQLKELSRLNHVAIRHAVVVQVVVDSAGVLQAATLTQGDSVLGAKVLAFVRQLPTQRPASFISALPHGHRTASQAQGEFSVLYTRSGKQLVGFNWYFMDKQLREEIAQEAQRRRAVFAKQFGRASTPLTLDGGLYYELVAGGLGWINCDRLLKPGPRILYTVGTPDPATVVSLVFKGQRSILASSRTEGSAAIFEQVPAGQAATVVALRRENGVTYLATSGVSLSLAGQPALSFHAVTLEQLRTELAQL
ncbi:hypothetical protein QMK33_14800 [Hymenobacter sp. H14-R3]|uniref:hypothetical protein n=1 Tax=Hymenobacter sp. H14-R3 TaxID=3046308 RepID=UPI0024BB80DB|nr:hypothetical protein [Hymenobacter sp. H14-R3]MDJ0366425.1 hypothetical protein [Hymenobacter sp. H14-R3]